jgi:hypothetical protein
MKKLCFLLLVSAICSFSFAQSNGGSNGSKMPPLDKSPMDMTYFPVDYPVLRIQEKATEPLVCRIIYSRPQKNNRTVFGELVEYNKIWRLGANEATEVEFFKDVKVDGKKLPKGKYTLYALPTPSEWTIIFNKETDIWGAFKYDEKKDVLRVKLPVKKVGEPIEAFSIGFAKSNGENTKLNIGWDTDMVSLPISTK